MLNRNNNNTTLRALVNYIAIDAAKKQIVILKSKSFF